MNATAEIPNETKRYASSSDEAHETYTKIPYPELITEP